MFYLIIVLLVIVLISIVFALIKRGNRVIYILTILFVFVVGIISFKFYPQISSYISQNKISVEKSKIEMIQNYINDKYDGEYKVTKSNFTYNGDGITGGIFMYSFDLKNKNGEKYIAIYKSYDDLSEKTLSKIELKQNK